jgi:hypothetical protein
MISTDTTGIQIVEPGRNVRNAADQVSPMRQRADPADCGIEDAPVEIRALRQVWPYHDGPGETGRATLAAKSAPKTSERQRGASITRVDVCGVPVVRDGQSNYPLRDLAWTRSPFSL